MDGIVFSEAFQSLWYLDMSQNYRALKETKYDRSSVHKSENERS